MAFDDPVVWALIIAAIVLLFGASKIPSLARSLGQARKEFNKGWKGDGQQQNSATTQQQTSTVPTASNVAAPAADDPLVVAAQKEGIQTQGKTREEIASELSWKLNKKYQQ